MILQVNLQEPLSSSNPNRLKVPILQALFFRWEHFENNIFIQYIWLYSLLRSFLWNFHQILPFFLKNNSKIMFFLLEIVNFQYGLHVACKCLFLSRGYEVACMWLSHELNLICCRFWTYFWCFFSSHCNNHFQYPYHHFLIFILNRSTIHFNKSH